MQQMEGTLAEVLHRLEQLELTVLNDDDDTANVSSIL